ncbi:MAG: ATP-dependent DNA helicase RecG [Planctomycetaceae bacterium]|nr:ATP-dependent DNA helicase RecG [Planctomycetaceae bacterium]
MADLTLDTPVQYVKGVGPVRAQQLAQLGIVTVEDLLTYFPFRFDLRRQVQPMNTLRGSEEAATVAGEVMAVHEHNWGPKPFFQIELADQTDHVMVKWFHGGYLAARIRPGVHLAVSGRVGLYREQLQLVNPRFQVLWDPQETKLDRDELLPVYPAGGALTSGMIAALVKHVLPEARRLIPRWYDQEYLEQRGLMSRPAAVEAMHRPEDKEHWGAARRRLAYDECMVMQLGIAITRMSEISRPAHPLKLSPAIDEHIRRRFPFPLTDAQNKAVAEIVADLQRDRPMNRLLQGDVGCGKTVVALYAALLAVARGKQAAIMAPTEILATQHFEKIQEYLAGSRVHIAMLVGGQGAAQRQAILADLESGKTNIIVGTHALISEGVRFADLALVVVDEQHKFGVRQRTSFRGKGFAPHYLVMTATPIPRTLAMTVFGDLDVSIIDALPPGRGTVTTRTVDAARFDEVLAFVADKLRAGQQAYFIYPLVTPSPDLELKAAEEAYHELSAGPLSEFGVALVHGQMSAADKNAAMETFRSAAAKVLVASVVVEVGVDVPAANVMVVMHPERFGLAQLHQLRGRIGRSRQNAACLLVTTPRNVTANERLAVLVKTHDGFEIAEEDLRLRGPGEIFGTRQHGLPELKVADLVEDFDLLRLARRDAFAIVNGDPGLNAPHHQQLRREVLRAYAGKLNLLGGA